MRKWKWAAAQRNSNRQRQGQSQLQIGLQPELTDDVRLADELDEDEQQEERIQFEPRIDQHQTGQRNFAYRPHEAGFRNHHQPVLDEETEIVNPLMQSGRFSLKTL